MNHIFLFYFGICVVVAGVIMAIAFAYASFPTNETQQANLTMRLSDNWQCGLIQQNTTLDQIRDCYRD